MTTGEENTDAPLLSLDLELAPAWARKTPEAHHQRFADDDRGGMDTRRPSGGRDGRHEGGRDRRPSRSPDDRRRDRPPSRDRNERAPRRDDRRRDDRWTDDRRETQSAPSREETAPPLPVEIRVLPDQKALGAIIRRIQTTHRAYPLRDIARLFLENPAAHQIRIEPVKGQSITFFQCKVCGMPAQTEDEIRAHVLSRHMEDFFDVSDVETEAPAGNFVCVAKCGLSGELLGPPNHHSFNTRVKELLRTRFPHMSAETYRSRIEMVRDQEVVNQWREQARKKKIYRRKRPASAVPAPAAAEPSAHAPVNTDANAAPPMAEEIASPALEKQAAEALFTREIAPQQILTAKHLVCPATAARMTPSRSLAFALRETMFREQKFPASLFFALRGAFRHRSLHLFRANNERGPDFVVVREPVALDATHVVSELRQVLEYINEHPGCTRQELLTTLAAGDEARMAHFATQLNTLIEKAHVIEYYNGVLAPPATHPLFHHLPSERAGGAPARRDNQAQKKPAEAREEAAPVVDAPTATPESTPAEESAPQVVESPVSEATVPATDSTVAPSAPEA